MAGPDRLQATPPTTNGHFTPLSPPLTPAPQHPSENSQLGVQQLRRRYSPELTNRHDDENAIAGHEPSQRTLGGATAIDPDSPPRSIFNGIEGFESRRPQHRHTYPSLGLHSPPPPEPHNIHSNKRTYTDAEHRRAFPRISRPLELLRDDYDVVVIGSGYGGGIAASRMARAGQSVCLLERGKEKWPGEYPSGTFDSLKEMHYSGKFAPFFFEGKTVDGGDPTGMFHVVFGRGQSAVVCNGLGGTSLINANVFMEADKRTLAMKMWPPQIRDHVDELDKYYHKVEKVLEPQEYPDDWPRLQKVETLKQQAEHLGYSEYFKKVRQTTRFHNGPNSCGVEMSPSNLTGQDATGINDGSKNTTLVTYLADAWNWGAEMYCESEVRYIEKAPKGPDGRDRGYIIYFAWHGRNRGHFKANLHGDLMWVRAKKAVFLGAGALGTTEILLRSKAMGLSMSDQVGQNMSGNGDILAFGYNMDEKVHAVGRAVPSPYDPIGPTINSVIDCREIFDNPLDGFVIEEGAVPHALARMLQAMLDFLPGGTSNPNDGLVARSQAALARYGSRFLGPYYKNGAAERTQVYLIMSHDSNQAVLTLENDTPVLEFLGVGRSAHVKELNEKLRKATEACGGTFVANPFFTVMGEQQVTVHPIGGAHMARDGTGATGVVNHCGEVFTGRGTETHDGLIVTDGAVVPVALGANPFATIAALAERSVEKYAEGDARRQPPREPLRIREDTNGILDLFGEPRHPHEHSLSSPVALRRAESFSIKGATKVICKAEAVKATGFGFTEVMSGFIHNDKNMKEDRRDIYELAYRTAKSQCESARFFLSAQAYNTKALVNEPQHRALLTGTFVCPTIEGSPFMVKRGEFNLLIMNEKAPGTRNLIYDFDMTGINGKKMHFHGYKVVDSSVALHPAGLWRSTTTLYVTISDYVDGVCDDLDDEDAWRKLPVRAKGMMHITLGDFMSQILTMTPTGSGLLAKALSAASFLTYFSKKSLGLFLAPFTALQYPSQTYSGYINNTPADNSVPVYAKDGVCTRLYIWEPTACPGNDPKNVKNLFMIPGASVDHQIFALPTIPFNAVNYFTRAGYRVFVTVHRIGQLMVAENMHTTYDARLDLKACLEYIRKEHGPEKVYTIAHCMGSVAFACGMLDGTIPSDWILGVTCSQVFMNPIWVTMNMAKVMFPPIPLNQLYTSLAGTWFSCSTSRDDSLPQRAINELLRLQPQPRRELCNSATCHRTSFVFGRCWNHRNLNEATHRQIDRFFGGVNMKLLELLMRQGSDGHVMTNDHERLTTRDNVERLRGVPFLLFVGRDNAVLSPEATERTYEILCDRFGGAAEGGMEEGVDYRRVVIPSYGHLDCWMGRNAWKDVYPMVREEVDRVTRGEKYCFEEPDDKFKRMAETGELLY